MSKRCRRRQVVVLALCVAGLGMFWMKEAGAQGREDKREAPTVDRRTGKKMSKAIELMNADKYAEARKILEEIAQSRFISPYETARVEQLLAYVSQGQRKYSEAREHLKKAIGSGGFNDQEILSARFQMAQLYMVDEKWKEGIAALKAWMAAGAEATPSAYYLLAVAYYQMKNYNGALQNVQKAVSMTDKPQEGWLQLLLALRLGRDQYKEALPIQVRLLQLAPTKGTYWMQLSNINSMLSKFEDALVAAQIAYYGGYISNDESALRRLSDLLLHANIPHRAARIMTAALDQKKIEGNNKNWEKLGTCWLAAREFDKAIGPLSRATNKAETGEPYIRLAEVHIEREDWTKAVRAIKQALDKGKLKRLSEAHVMMGMALTSLKKYKDAKGYFQRALDNEKTRTQAQSWLAYIDSQIKGK